MTPPAAIVKGTAVFAEIAEAAAAQGYEFPMNPRASAVAFAFLAMLRGEIATDGSVRLGDLVTPDSLPTWQSLFADPERRAAYIHRLRFYGFVYPLVQPRPDGSVVVLLAETHPDETPAAHVTEERRSVWAYKVVLRLVENPDDWRVHAIP